MIYTLYLLLPLVLSLSFFYSALRLTKIIKYSDKEKQNDFEEYHLSNNNLGKIVGSIFGGVFFLIIFLTNIV
jgi:hypothetical protein